MATKTRENQKHPKPGGKVVDRQLKFSETRWPGFWRGAKQKWQLLHRKCVTCGRHSVTFASGQRSQHKG